MAVDVSNLVNMLATQPGQNVANIGGALLGAQENVRQREADATKAAIEQRKLQLEEAVTNQQLKMGEIEMMGKRGEILSSLSQAMLQPGDPLVKQQVLATQVPLLKKVGISDEQIQMGIQNINNPDFWKTIQVPAVAASDFWRASNSSGVDLTVAARKKKELIEAGVDPVQAEGVAYDTYKVITDPSTGDQKVIDLRQGGREVSQSEADVVKGVMEPPEEAYRPKIITKGTREELQLQDSVRKLSQDMIKTGAPKVESPLQTVEAIIRDTYEKGGDLPGYGATSALPDWAVSVQAQNLRQSAIKLFNIELAERSGAAVTKQELDRLKDEFKTGVWRTDRQFVTGVRQYRELLEDYKKAVVAGYPNEVVSKYQLQGGLKLQEPPTAATPVITEDQIREDAKANNWSEEQIQEAIKKYVRK